MSMNKVKTLSERLAEAQAERQSQKHSQAYQPKCPCGCGLTMMPKAVAFAV